MKGFAEDHPAGTQRDIYLKTRQICWMWCKELKKHIVRAEMERLPFVQLKNDVWYDEVPEWWYGKCKNNSDVEEAEDFEYETKLSRPMLEIMF